MARYDSNAKPDNALEDAKECFARMVEAEAENRKDALDDLRFARLGEQWPEDVRRKRELTARPCLTINKLPAFIRQAEEKSIVIPSPCEGPNRMSAADSAMTRHRPARHWVRSLGRGAEPVLSPRFRAGEWAPAPSG